MTAMPKYIDLKMNKILMGSLHLFQTLQYVHFQLTQILKKRMFKRLNSTLCSNCGLLKRSRFGAFLSSCLHYYHCDHNVK